MDFVPEVSLSSSGFLVENPFIDLQEGGVPVEVYIAGLQSRGVEDLEAASIPCTSQHPFSYSFLGDG